MNAIWGAGGYIGSGIANLARHDLVFHRDKVVAPGRILPNWKGVVWCAGWPGTKNVDDVEVDPVRSELQNVWEPLELAQRCRKQGVRLLIISSGCIFDKLNAKGEPHREMDQPNFLKTVYLRHKAHLEHALFQIGGDITIFRIRIPFDGRHHPRNTLHKLAQFPAVWDKQQSYTWLPDLSRAVTAWEDGKINSGIWHVTQPGITSNYEGVRDHLNPNVARISGGDRPDPSMISPRSAAILDSSKIQKIISMTPIKEAWEISARQLKAQIVMAA